MFRTSPKSGMMLTKQKNNPEHPFPLDERSLFLFDSDMKMFFAKNICRPASIYALSDLACTLAEGVDVELKPEAAMVAEKFLNLAV